MEPAVHAFGPALLLPPPSLFCRRSDLVAAADLDTDPLAPAENAVNGRARRVNSSGPAGPRKPSSNPFPHRCRRVTNSSLTRHTIHTPPVVANANKLVVVSIYRFNGEHTPQSSGCMCFPAATGSLLPVGYSAGACAPIRSFDLDEKVALCAVADPCEMASFIFWRWRRFSKLQISTFQVDQSANLPVAVCYYNLFPIDIADRDRRGFFRTQAGVGPKVVTDL